MTKQVSLQILVNLLFLFSLIFFLVFFQFHNRSSTFRLGDFTFFIKEVRENKEKFLSSVRLEGRAIEMLFKKENSLLKEGYYERPLEIKGFSANKDNFMILFENGIYLSFFLDQDKFLLISSNNLPSSSASIKIPLALASKSIWSQSEEEPNLIHIINQKKSLKLFLNEDSLVNNFKGDFIFISDEAIKIGPLESREILPSEEPLVKEDKTTIGESISSFNFSSFTEERLREEVTIFRNKAYRGITGRFNRTSGTWSRNNQNLFTEKALVATLAESINRNTYSSQLSQMRSAYNNHNTEASVLSALYLGDIINEDLKTREMKEQNISNLLKQSSLLLTIEENMAKDLFMYSSNSNFERIMSLWENTNFLNENWNLSQIGNFLLNYSDSRYLTGRPVSQNIMDRIQELLNQKAKVKEGRYYLVNQTEQEDVEGSIKIASSILELAKNTTESESLNKLKEQALALLIGALSQANDQGEWIQQEKTIYPEDIYEFVSQNAYLPKLVVLSRINRSWVFLASEVVSQNIRSDLFLFQLGFASDYAQHMIVSGITYPELVNFRGITWRTDPQFQIYTDGWGYLSRNQSLYLKISHFLGKNIDLRVEL